MICLTNLPDFRKFLSSVLVKATKNEMAGWNQVFEQDGIPWYQKVEPRSKMINKSFWFDRLADYSIVESSISEDFTYYARVDLVLDNKKRSDLFVDAGFLLVSTNYGLMVLYFDETGSIEKLELNFRVEKRMPPFLFDLIKHFPKEDSAVDRAVIEHIKELGTLPIDAYLRNFRRKKLQVVEVE